jgi:hypothetical protein
MMRAIGYNAIGYARCDGHRIMEEMLSWDRKQRVMNALNRRAKAKKKNKQIKETVSVIKQEVPIHGHLR